MSYNFRDNVIPYVKQLCLCDIFESLKPIFKCAGYTCNGMHLTLGARTFLFESLNITILNFIHKFEKLTQHPKMLTG